MKSRLQILSATLCASMLALAASRAPANAHTRRVTRAWNYVVHVDGIAVTDSAGSVMRSPFLGGFDVPRPQLVDINGDGLPDLFLQERPGELMYFEHIGDHFEWRTDQFQNLDIGEWYRFVDVDGDGVLDLFSEMQTGYIRLWHNAGTRTSPKFVALGDTIRDVDGRALVADRQNILTAVDIDCNGKLDLFIGRTQGVVDRYEQEGTSPGGAPRFRLIEENWQGIEVLGPEGRGEALSRIDTAHGPSATESAAAFTTTRRHGANTLAFADVSKRGVLDLYWGDFFEEGLLRFQNTGTCARPDFTAKPARFPFTKPVLSSGYNAPTFADVDGDGRIDMVMGVIGGAYGPNRTAIENLYYVRQRADDDWSVVTKRLINTIDVGSESAPTLADINGDGLLDLIIGSKVAPEGGVSGTMTWFANVGTATQPAFREMGLLPMRGDYNYAPAVVDLDGDGKMDIVVGTWRDRLQWYRNVGTTTSPLFVMADTALVTITRGTNSTPSFGDINGDGLVDLVIGEASGTINLYLNRGTKSSPRFELVSDEFQHIKVGRRSAPTLVDMDGDGKLDMLIGNADGQLQLWRNITVGAEVRFERDPTFVVQSQPNAIPAVGDLHGPGSRDLLVGTTGGGIKWFSRGNP